MHRTLFTPSMVEAFRICKTAYKMGQAQYAESSSSAKTRLKSVTRRFILRGLAEINRGKLTTVNQVQRYMGQHWPVDILSADAKDKDNNTRAFLFAYKTLTRYVGKPYKPNGSEIVGVAQKVRARVPHLRVYVEDTMDLMIWHPKERRLELVDYQLTPIAHHDPRWPSATILVKQYLAERLKMRFPYERVTLTFFRAGSKEHQPVSLTVDESIFALHWSELVKTLETMKEESQSAVECSSNCRHCQTATESAAVETEVVTQVVTQAVTEIETEAEPDIEEQPIDESRGNEFGVELNLDDMRVKESYSKTA